MNEVLSWYKAVKSTCLCNAKNYYKNLDNLISALAKVGISANRGNALKTAKQTLQKNGYSI